MNCNHQKTTTTTEQSKEFKSLSLPVLRKSALAFNRFRIDDSAKRGNTRLISSIRIRRGFS